MPLREQRETPEGERYFVFGDTVLELRDDSWPACPILTIEQVRPWLLPSVVERLERGAGEFLAGFKPAVALFIRFSGIAYDGAPDPGARLDSLVALTQRTLDEYGGDQSLTDMAKAYLSLESRARRNDLVEKSTFSGLKDVWMSTWINGLLSSPVSHAKNIIGNSLFGLYQIPKRAVAALLRAMRVSTQPLAERPGR